MVLKRRVFDSKNCWKILGIIQKNVKAGNLKLEKATLSNYEQKFRREKIFCQNIIEEIT